MKRTKVLGLCLVAVFAMSGLVAAQASAMEFAWHVNGSKLEAGKEKALTSKAKGAQVLKTAVIGIKVEISCAEASTAGAKIIGGIPGTSTETVEYKGCTVAKPSGCKVKGGTITTNPLKDEIVEGVGTSAGKALVLFAPVTGKVFAEPKLEGGFTCLSLAVEGSVLAEANPQLQEVTTGVLKFEPANGKESKNSKGVTNKDGLTVSGNAATVTGEVETTLSPAETFGVF
jgi:DsbC/DsbD-like thiol-disulfide interchange protein